MVDPDLLMQPRAPPLLQGVPSYYLHAPWGECVVQQCRFRHRSFNLNINQKTIMQPQHGAQFTVVEGKENSTVYPHPQRPWQHPPGEPSPGDHLPRGQAGASGQFPAAAAASSSCPAPVLSWRWPKGLLRSNNVGRSKQVVINT